MNELSKIPALFWRLLLAAALVAVFSMSQAQATQCDCVTPAAQPPAESWIFSPGRYTHDPDTGGRVAQYAMKPPVEPLPDPRAVTSGYSRTRQVLRGADGTANTYYRVQSFGNGRGGIDAEWERFHDAWRGSTIGGGNYFAFPGFGFGGGFPGFGFGGAGYGVGGPGHGGHGDHQDGRYQHGVGRPGFRFDPRQQYGRGFGRPDAGLLDPDGADGYPDGRTRTPDRRFFNQAVPTPKDLMPKKKPKPSE